MTDGVRVIGNVFVASIGPPIEGISLADMLDKPLMGDNRVEIGTIKSAWVAEDGTVQLSGVFNSSPEGIAARSTLMNDQRMIMDVVCERVDVDDDDQ